MKSNFYYLLLCLLVSPTILSAQAWFTRVEFNEAGMPGFPTSTTTLADATTPVWTQNFDILNKGAAICNGPNAFVYSEAGGDAVNDINVTITRVVSAGNSWTQAEGDYATTSSGSWRSDYSINDQQSRPNDFAYIKVEMTFLGDVPTSICPSLLNLSHTTTNGSSEAYEWTLVSINDNITAAEEALIGSYKNINYSDISGSTYFDSTGAVINAGAATNSQLPNGISISEHITGLTDVGNQGGFLRPGLWTIDDFNTNIFDGPEGQGTNPIGGNGATNDNQTINGVTDLGMSVGTPINKITYYFGLTDVAFDTDNDGDTRTNSLPAASWTWMELGFPTPPTITSTSGNCIDSSGTAAITVADGAPSFILSGDIVDTSMTSSIAIMGLAQGTYNFTLTDAKGCIVADSVVITAPCGVLPINLVSFEGRQQNTTNQLSWVTTAEVNNSHFIVERSSDALSFEPLGQINSQTNTAESKEYSFTDYEPIQGSNYYRLQQVDLNQQATFSKVINIKRDIQNEVATFYQKNGSIKGTYYSTNSKNANFKLYTMNGTLLIKEKLKLHAGHNKIAVNPASSFSTGLYIIQFEVVGQKPSTSKILLH